MTLASELAQRQFAAIARRQLLEAGFSSRRVKSWLASGRLHRRYPGIYIWGRPDTGTEGDLAAALLYAGRGSALGGISALWWQGLLEHRPRLIHVDAAGRRRAHADVRIRHPHRISRTGVGGIPVNCLPEVLLAATAHLEHDSLRLVLARAEFKQLLSLPSLQSSLGPGRAGSAALRAAMDAHLPQLARCANGFERDFVLLCERFGLPIPEPNVRIGRYVPDMLWRGRRLIVELDGKDAHSSPAQINRDAARQAHLESLGYVVIRFTWAEVSFRAEWVATRVRLALSG